MSIAREGAEVVVSIRDDGTGIEAAMLPRIFEVFAQVKATIQRAQGGIGLTLVRRLVELHGGSVVASSAGIGHGSTFAVRLPLRERAAPEQDTRPPDVPQSRHPRRAVLVVEDNEDIREMLCAWLERLGHTVDGVGDGKVALERALESHPEVVLMDIGLPGMDGYQAARAIRSALGPNVLLVAMTKYGQVADRIQARDSGFDVHLTKPVEPTALGALLSRADLHKPSLPSTELSP